MSRKFIPRAIAVTSSLLLLTACGATGTNGPEPSAGDAISDVEVIVGNSPGGGYDTMARQIAQVLDSEEIASGVRVVNKPGAGGTVALQQLANQEGDENALMTTGLAVTGAVVTNNSPVTMEDTTPIARVLEEPMIIAVSADSEYETIDDLVAAWKEDTGGLTAGGGAIGGPDYQQVMLLAQTTGIDPSDVNFVTYDGGGELLPAILGGKVAFTASGYAEWADQIDAGDIRVLAVSGEERIDAIDAPTLQEAGIDLTFTNWRGFIAAPGISDERQEQLATVFQQLHESPEWQETLEQNGQLDAFLSGDEFESFLEEEQSSVTRVLEDAGLL